jgi:hypothetical protein
LICEGGTLLLGRGRGDYKTTTLAFRNNGGLTAAEFDSGNAAFKTGILDPVDRLLQLPDSARYIAFRDAEGWIGILAADIKEPLLISRRRQAIDALAFSSDGTKLATAAGTEVIVWDVVGAYAVQPLLRTLRKVPTGASRAAELEALLPLARQRLTRSLGPKECQYYFGSSGCPK